MLKTIDPKLRNSSSRPNARRRVLLTGLIVYGNGAFTCDCSFRNLSATGARIAVPQLLQLPTRFYVINVREGVAYDSTIVWNRGKEIGIKYDAQMSLSAKPDLVISQLRRLWLAKTSR